MIFKDKLCYSHLLWLMANPKFTQSVYEVKFDTPLIQYEGMAGYIETSVEFSIKNLKDFSEIFDDWWNQDNTIRIKFREFATEGYCNGK